MSGSSSFAAGYVVGMVIALVLFVGGPIAIGYFLAGRLSEKKGGAGSVKWPVRTGFAISAFLLLAFCVGQTARAHSDEISVHG